MTTRFHFEDIKESDKQFLEKYFNDKKIGRLKKLLLHGNFELAKFDVNAKYRKRHDLFEVIVGLNFAGKGLRGEEKEHTLTEAFDLAFDRVISQLRKSESKLHDK
ncbi:MAG: HPF/RaiA family ribosome-associated protein [Candidatus Nealsonbacteria bacterium]|nr:HPF/RaiA family ribosome-associated protein [Candidatus Nealsonbacteria bacterium]